MKGFNMTEAVERLNELENHLKQQNKTLKGELQELQTQVDLLKERITYNEGRIFEVNEISEYLKKEAEDANNTTGRDTGTAETGGQQPVD